MPGAAAGVPGHLNCYKKPGSLRQALSRVRMPVHPNPRKNPATPRTFLVLHDLINRNQMYKLLFIEADVQDDT